MSYKQELLSLIQQTEGLILSSYDSSTEEKFIELDSLLNEKDFQNAYPRALKVLSGLLSHVKCKLILTNKPNSWNRFNVMCGDHSWDSTIELVDCNINEETFFKMLERIVVSQGGYITLLKNPFGDGFRACFYLPTVGYMVDVMYRTPR